MVAADILLALKQLFSRLFLVDNLYPVCCLFGNMNYYLEDAAMYLN